MLYQKIILTTLSILFVCCGRLFSQESNDFIPLESRVEADKVPSLPYRPGMNFQSANLNQNSSRANLIDSASVTVESGSVGRHGAIRLDGAATLPILAMDGFLIQDPSINQGQVTLDSLPFDFAERVDIYKQNLVPFGVNAGSLIDFRIPIKYKNERKLTLLGTTTGNLYTKFQGEQTFSGGSTFYGILGDFGLTDYYYGINNGANFAKYTDSTYERFSFLSKTVWENLELLLANTYYQGFNEAGLEPYASCRLTRNSLIAGLRYNKNIFNSSINYTFQNLMSSSKSHTNDYLKHQLNMHLGVGDTVNRYRYQIQLGYEHRDINDGPRAIQENYLSVPKFGEHAFNLLTEFSVSVYKEEDNPTINTDFNFSLNQIMTLAGLYTPVPSFSIGIRHKNGVYGSLNVSRVYLIPDLSSAYGFGHPDGSSIAYLKPKDGVRTGFEIGFNGSQGRIFANMSYGWLNHGFRLTQENTIENSQNVTAISAELGGEYRKIIDSSIIILNTGLAFNYEVDFQGFASTPIPLWKWIVGFTAKSIDDFWTTSVSYRLTFDTPNTSGFVDKTPRHYLDWKSRYKIFIFNILNLANQSYRPIPENIYSPYNPGIRVETGFEFKF